MFGCVSACVLVSWCSRVFLFVCMYVNACVRVFVIVCCGDVIG